MGAGQSQQSQDAGLDNVRLQMQQQEEDDDADVYIPPAPAAGYTEERWLAERVRQNNGLQLERERQKAEGYDLPVGADPEAIARVNRVPVRDPRSQQGAKKEDLNGDALEYRFPSGSLYVGGFREGLLHGYGKYLYAPSGDSYEGDWRQDRKHGFGTYIFASGDRYVGEWQHGMKHGKGIYTFRNGDTLRGSWDSDHVCGFGVFFAGSEGHAAGGVKYEGEWQQSFRHGFGSQQHLNGNLYEGRWYLGKEHGLGVLQYAQDGGLYVGDWNNGLQDGRGILVEGGQKYLVLFTAGVLEAKEPIGATDPVPPEFERAARAYQKWISRVRIPAGAVDDLPFSLDREGFDLLKTERDDWERRYRELMKHVAVAHDNDEWATESNPAALRERLQVALQQRDAERQRADDLEAFTARVRALAAFGLSGNGSGSGGNKSRDLGGVEGMRPKLEAAEAELAALRGQQQQSARQRDKYNDAHRTILAQQAQIDELLRELAMQRQRATTLQAQANLDANNGGVGKDGFELNAEMKELRSKAEQATGTSLAWEEKAKKAQLRLAELEKLHAKTGDADSNKLMADLAEARSTVQAQAARIDEMEAEYKKERKKHKRAAQDRDEAKSVLLTVETESARALRQFRIAVGGKMLVLGSLDGNVAAQGVELSSAGASAVASQDAASDATVRLSEDRLGFVVEGGSAGAEQKIVLDAAFPLQRQEQELFDETRFAVRAVANGINASLVFFGPRGEESTKETVTKVAPRAFDELFKALTTLQSGFDVSVTVSAIEVLATGAVDLLSKTSDNAPVKFMKDSFGTVVLSGATAVNVSDAGSANKAFYSAMGRKAGHKAASNLMFTVQVRAEHVASKAVLMGKLVIADLCAAFEPADGAQYRRDTAMSLTNAIETLARGRPLEPRADDQMLLGLSDAIGGNSRTFLICCVHNQSPVDAALQRTLASARTATQIINQPMQHFESAEVAHLLDIVGRVAPAEKPPRVFEIVKP